MAVDRGELIVVVLVGVLIVEGTVRIAGVIHARPVVRVSEGFVDVAESERVTDLLTRHHRTVLERIKRTGDILLALVGRGDTLSRWPGRLPDLQC